MHVILWRFQARPGRERDFEKAYGPEGAWERLFRDDPDFLGTELLRGSDGAYLTLDRWTSAASFNAFRERNAAAYAAVDALCAGLCESETPLGSVEI
jgi:heme-degrading monooxygenase HmoA